MLRAILFISLILSSFLVSARGVYQTDQDFLSEAFNESVPKSKVVWIKSELAASVKEILGHKYAGLRIRYWRDEQRSVWILEEIGKEKPITFGVVVSEQKIETIKVLAFRESRGGEIRYPAFTEQFKLAALDNMQLDRHIDGVSGATLSVRAMTAVARLALYLDIFTG